MFQIAPSGQGKQRYCTVFKSFHYGKRFLIGPFSLIVFGVVVWTIAVSGTKQYHFRLKTVWCESVSIALF